MSKKIILVDKDKNTDEEREYTLEYTRQTVKEMQGEGFRLDDFDNRQVLVIPALFAGAFKAHHRKVKADVIERLFDNTPDKTKLIEVLLEMYAEPINALMDEPAEDEEKNVSWGVRG